MLKNIEYVIGDLDNNYFMLFAFTPFEYDGLLAICAIPF